MTRIARNYTEHRWHEQRAAEEPDGLLEVAICILVALLILWLASEVGCIAVSEEW